MASGSRWVGALAGAGAMWAQQAGAPALAVALAVVAYGASVAPTVAGATRKAASGVQAGRRR